MDKQTERLLFYDMVAQADVRGRIFMGSGSADPVVPVEPPVPCRHVAHEISVVAYGIKDVLRGIEHDEGAIFYSLGNHQIAPGPPHGGVEPLVYDVDQCRPVWRPITGVDWLFVVQDGQPAWVPAFSGPPE